MPVTWSLELRKEKEKEKRKILSKLISLDLYVCYISLLLLIPNFILLWKINYKELFQLYYIC